jgi:hypothetical protein
LVGEIVAITKMFMHLIFSSIGKLPEEMVRDIEIVPDE